MNKTKKKFKKNEENLKNKIKSSKSGQNFLDLKKSEPKRNKMIKNFKIFFHFWLIPHKLE